MGGGGGGLEEARWRGTWFVLWMFVWLAHVSGGVEVQSRFVFFFSKHQMDEKMERGMTRSKDEKDEKGLEDTTVTQGVLEYSLFDSGEHETDLSGWSAALVVIS